ncbi:MAG: flagellar basal-body rod protein FlgF [Candidatus Glassbacteria bacterium]|nr:flagellar basal-body rod protein FlgF [Candidatus Glassbacteria bacterium]
MPAKLKLINRNRELLESVAMIKGLYTSAGGMLPLQYRQDLVANNLSNSHTAGYKQDQAFVRELITADLYLNERKIASTGAQPPLVSISPPAYMAAVGDSRQVVQQYTDFSQGPMEATGNAMNMAIEGDGFFTIQTPNGTQYTRNGSFSINENGELVTIQGHLVLGDGGPINVSGGIINVLKRGGISVNGVFRDNLRITDFPKPYEMTKVSENLFVPESGGAGQNAENYSVQQGMLEGSNGHPLDQMVKMIEISRMFELGQRAIRLQDETLQQAVTQAGRV